ncbi:MAG: cupin -type [Lasallia pustulata]|uniref:Cupin-type n=1 Tax=Lasallia pustulata TaxID=136370 RepID=A0A5M8PZ35_9LECA|nr:MAG: cupin -type [Lasallia pustulata]
MSAPSYWLQRQRKSDLQNLADQVGLKDYESLKKTELESALDEHMRANQTHLSQDPSFDPFYKRVHATASPLKKPALALIPRATAVAAVDTPKEKKPRPRRSLIKPRDAPTHPQ